jgi:hypothetical protein
MLLSRENVYPRHIVLAKRLECLLVDAGFQDIRTEPSVTPPTLLKFLMTIGLQSMGALRLAGVSG